MMNTQLTLPICAMILSAVLVWLVTPSWIRYLKRTRALDVPNHRSAHKEPTPTMGGFTFIAGLICAVLFSWDGEIMLTSVCISAAGLIGLRDDLVGITPKVKFVLQGIIATALFVCGISIAPFIEVTLGLDLPLFVDWFLTVLFVLGVKNAFNLIDGVDGLLIGITLISSIVLTLVFYVQGQLPFMILTMSMIGVSIAFLIYNFQPAKIFMGDTGSLFIGTYISACILKVGELGDAKLSFISLSIVLFACVDMLRLFLGRYLILKKPFTADRNHFHHILLNFEWSHKKIVLLEYALQIAIICLAMLLPRSSSFTANLFILIFASISFYGGLQFLVFRADQKRWKIKRLERDKKIGDNHLFKSYLK